MRLTILLFSLLVLIGSCASQPGPASQVYAQYGVSYEDDPNAYCVLAKSCTWRAYSHLRQDDPVSQRHGRAYLRKGCDLGDENACYQLAWRYAAGEHVAKNDALAVDLYSLACEAGQAAACNNLGVMYRLGRGLDVDDRRGFDMFVRACKARISIACSNVGSFYETGQFVHANHNRAFRLYDFACNRGADWACFRQARHYEHGGGVEADPPKAVELYERACEGGVSDACLAFARLYYTGEFVERDVSRARELLRKGCTLSKGQEERPGCDIDYFEKATERRQKREQNVLRWAIYNHQESLQKCFTTAVNQDITLQGKLFASWQVVPGGDVSDVSLIESSLGNEAMEACVLAVIAEMKVGWPVGSPPRVIEHGFSFLTITAGKNGRFRSPPSERARSRSICPSDVWTRLADIEDRFDTCAGELDEEFPDGGVITRWLIERSGAVSFLEGASTLANDEAMQCVQAELEKLDFGPRPGLCTIYHAIPISRRFDAHTIIYVPSQKPDPERGRKPTILI